MQYIPRICQSCGAKKSELRDEVEYMLKCKCDWERQFWPMLTSTVHESFRHKSMGDWSPKLFSEAQSRSFKRLIKVQKADAIAKVWNFAFRPFTKGVVTTNALTKSIQNRHNLFIRGPKNSGRGLITASIKLLAAVRGIQSTPLPGDFDTFKAELAQTESFSAAGADARILVSQKYEDPPLLALEDVRGELITRYSGDKIPKKSKAADAIDRLLAARALRPGAMLLSGPDFIGQLQDTLGDRLPEILDSDNTSIILLFHPKEADALLAGLKMYRESLEDVVRQAIGTGSNEKLSTKDKKYFDEQAELLRQALYFEEAFPNVPEGCDPNGSVGQGICFYDMVTDDEKRLHKKMLEVVRTFNAAKASKDEAYADGVRTAQINAARSCKTLASRMTERELYETGRLMSMATMPAERVAEIIEKARAMRDKMSGASKDI
jgi:hypothetical protein